ncbi:hypothetical protein BST81_00600 [Leptolyngbya sp. 'hensonii']|uniref:choice-of-anchor L domain-containing protein n=1 Tax=Leptolyngbya sp. 'hensonii' TaxID=1922337 RepID=UPI00094FCC09|nr:choice-of-anchor L domain-containing protein [Leptolyngbya sp. 'hensonii']OLP20275.1 hypothetical protein BST81_00600 [Leptolyngbya sp. 'hensonii']
MKALHTLATAFAVTAATVGIGSSAMAFTITPNNNGTDLLNALLGTTTGLSNFSVTPTGGAAAFGLFSADPFGLTDGIVLSTGEVVDVVGPNDAPNESFDFGATGVAGDDISLDISFDADATADKLFFSYVFGSEEFPEFVKQGFNDSFELLLNGVNLAKLNNGDLVTVDNLGSGSPDFISNPPGSPGTQLDGYSTVLTFEGLLNKNAKNTLSIKIKDVGDGIFDSAVLIKGKSLGTVKPIPEPAMVLGLLSFGGLMVQRRRMKKA